MNMSRLEYEERLRLEPDNQELLVEYIIFMRKERRKKEQRESQVYIDYDNFIRPDVSFGYWLMPLVSLVLASNYGHGDHYHPAFDNVVLTISANTMCLQSLLVVFLCCRAHTFRVVVILFVVAVIFAGYLMSLALEIPFYNGIGAQFVINIIYVMTYLRTLRSLPKSFSFGEASIFVQGFVLFGLYVFLNWKQLLTPIKLVDQMRAAMMLGLFYLLLFCIMLNLIKLLRRPNYFYSLLVLLMSAICFIPISKRYPIVIFYNFIRENEMRITLVCYYAVVTTTLIFLIWWKTFFEGKASPPVRKIFHVYVVLVYLPGILLDFNLVYVVSGILLTILIVLETLRTLLMPPFGVLLIGLYAHFSDKKDSGLIFVTPIALIVGCSMPLWVIPCLGKIGYLGSTTDKLLMLSGVLSVGIGDSAACFAGALFKGLRWPDARHTLIGTIMYYASIYNIVLAVFKRTITTSGHLVLHAAVITTMLIEGSTDQIDNLVLPFVFYIMMNMHYLLSELAKTIWSFIVA